ncbi:HEAT repeat domain-containing protein [Desulfomarina sp.]
MENTKSTVSDKELKKVIADFLDQGHVENIIAMFRREPSYYAWTGDLLLDDRFSVRLGLSVLFEELAKLQPQKTVLAIPSLIQVLANPEPLLRGEAVSLLGIIGTKEAIAHVRLLENDENPQVREMVTMILEEHT